MNAKFLPDWWVRAGKGRTASTIEHLCIVATPNRNWSVLKDVKERQHLVNPAGRVGFQRKGAVSQMISYSVEA